MSSPQLDINERINIAVAVGGYLRAVDSLDAASQALTKACSELRAQIPRQSRFVIQAEYRHYLISSDIDRNFEVELIESL